MYYYHTYEDDVRGPPYYGNMHKATSLANAIKGCRRELARDEYSLGVILKANKFEDLITRDYAYKRDTDKYVFRRTAIVGTIERISHYNDPNVVYIYHTMGSKTGYRINADGSRSKI